MNRREARSILLRKLVEYRRLPYNSSREMIGRERDHYEISAPSGTEYQLEIEVFRDGRPGGDIRVIGAIDDGRVRRACCPLGYTFLVVTLEPSGTICRLS